MKIYDELEQGSVEWLEARRGIITASEVGLLITPTGQVAKNETVRAHMWELLAQRTSGYVEPMYISDDMLRGIHDEVLARDLYSEHHAPVKEIGFVTNEIEGETVGYSPDGFVGDDGLIEIKSRRQKFQIKAIALDEIPKHNKAQMCMGMMVTGRKWCDYVSYSAGLPMFVKRYFPEPELVEGITEAIGLFSENITPLSLMYEKNADRFVMTEREEDDFDFGDEA